MILITLKRNSKILNNDPQNNCLFLNKDDVNGKFEEYVKKKKGIANQVIRKRMIVRNNLINMNYNQLM
jgi:hypothetical protein